MKSITRIEDAYELPEKSQLIIKEEVQPDGAIMRIPYFRDMVARTLSDAELSDELLYFIDRDGRMMRVEYDTEGAYKIPFHQD